MIPFGLKVAWFCLSLSGLLSCWATMLAFGQALRAYELPLLYCIGCTLLEGSFCLGIMWKMDTFRMPRAFCIAQSTFMGFGTFLITGVAAAISIGTSLTVLKPKTWGDHGKSSLVWRDQYILLVLVFPLAALTAQLSATLHTHWPVERADDFHCDYSDDLVWIRLLSYAGTPLLVSIPSLYLSVKSIIRVLKVCRHLRRARDSDVDIGTTTPRRPEHLFVARANSTLPPSSYPSARREPLSQMLTSPNLTAQNFHMPVLPPLNIEDLNLDSSVSSMVTNGTESPVSSSFPTFANPPEGGTITIDPDGVSVVETTLYPMGVLGPVHSLPDTTMEDLSYPSPEDDKSDFEYGTYVEQDDEDHKSGVYTAQQIPKSSRVLVRNTQRQHPNLAPAIWSMILFQCAFTSVQILSCISSLIAVVTHRPPTSFGTQHVALLLVVWGPVVVFGHLPSVQRTFWTWLSLKWRSP